jgi:hypothetical protein
LLLLIGTVIKAQSLSNDYIYNNTSLDITTNPASVAMGESFVANPNNVSSFIENPANLSASKQLGLFYNYRSNDWIELAKNYNFISVGGSPHTSWGMIGFSLSQFSSGTNSINIYSDLTSKDVNRTYQLSVAKLIIPNLFIGASIKIFNHSKNGEGIQSNIGSNNAYLFDLGLRYRVDLGSKPEFQNEFNFGAAVQNIGTDYKEKNSFFSDQYNLIRLPKYLKIGFAYNLQLNNLSGTSNIEATVTGQYKNLLNPLSFEATNVDYWGAGLEIFIKSIFTARVGFFQLPEKSVIYNRANPILRYGFGFVLPFEKLGIYIPLVMSIDYTFIPINSTSTMMDGYSFNNMLHAIGLALRYKSVFF